MTSTVTGNIAYYPADGGDITTHPPFAYDMRKPESRAGNTSAAAATEISNARQASGLGLHSSGFQLLQHTSAVSDFLDSSEVMRVYYEECRTLARQLTGAAYVYTFDHLVREPDRQISGGGTDGKAQITGVQNGGGYIGFAHMDYTNNTTWADYLAVHKLQPPAQASRIISLNFWRGLSPVVDDFPLAVCDARTVKDTDLFETVVYGYGAHNYSWHNIGIETYSVKYSAAQRWFYYPRMTPDEVLVFKSFDSRGVIGHCCPHSAFANPSAGPDTPPRRSIELRVLCFVV